MFEVRIHGRGGQGVVTAADLLALAAFDAGLHAQSFPSFGSERSGAPVVAFCRLNERPIRVREPIIAPDALIVTDPTLLHQVDLFSGVGAQGYVLINSARTLEELHLQELRARFAPERLRTVPATDMARRHLGRPLPNAALLGGFAALTGAVSLAAVTGAIRQRFQGQTARGNAAAAEAAFAAVRRPTALLESTHA